MVLIVRGLVSYRFSGSPSNQTTLFGFYFTIKSGNFLEKKFFSSLQ